MPILTDRTFTACVSAPRIGRLTKTRRKFTNICKKKKRLTDFLGFKRKFNSNLRFVNVFGTIQPSVTYI